MHTDQFLPFYTHAAGMHAYPTLTCNLYVKHTLLCKGKNYLYMYLSTCTTLWNLLSSKSHNIVSLGGWSFRCTRQLRNKVKFWKKILGFTLSISILCWLFDYDYEDLQGRYLVYSNCILTAHAVISSHNTKTIYPYNWQLWNQKQKLAMSLLSAAELEN